MKELLEILSEFDALTAIGKRAALATVVKTSGSAYRRPGARMLMTEDGRMIGSVSGGCLEADVFEHSKDVLETGKPRVVAYNTASDDDGVWGLGMGCNGEVHVLIEPLHPENPRNPLAFLKTCVTNDRTVVSATVFRSECAEIPPGTRLTADETGDWSSTASHPGLRDVLHSKCRTGLTEGRSRVETLKTEGGTVEVFIEIVEPPAPLVIFGGGHDAQPLVRLAKELGWRVTVADHRPMYADTTRFPLADKVLHVLPEDVPSKIPLTRRTAAVVMTHNYLKDLELLKLLLPSPIAYLGVLGPKRRTERLLAESGLEATDEQLERLFSPVGLDLGAETPEEIALSILAEIRAVTNGYKAGSLRDREGPIHQA